MQKRCSYCKRFKELDNFKNTGKHCIARSYFKLCADCRQLMRCYRNTHERPVIKQKQKYKPRPAVYMDPLEHYCNEYEVEPHIFYDPNVMVCFVKTDELFLLGITIYLNSNSRHWWRLGNSEIGPLVFLRPKPKPMILNP